ncbi:MAG: ATP-binding protein [Kiritimatiellia bacterium]
MPSRRKSAPKPKSPGSAPAPPGASVRTDPLVDLVPGVVYTLDVLPGGGRRFREVSTQLEDLLGFLPAEWIASPRCWEQQIHPDDRAWVLESVAKAEEAGELRAFDYRLIRRTGEILWFRDLARRLDPPGAHLLRYRGVLLDITARKRAELALMRSGASDARHVSALGRLAGGIAHDFNNLLTSIMGHAQLLQMDLPAGHRHREYADHILASGERAAALVERLIHFSKRPAGALGPLDLSAWLRRTSATLRQLVPPGVTLQISPAGEALWINGDESPLETALLNLVGNSVDASGRGSRITVTLDPVELSTADAAAVGGHAGSHARLSVQDDGEGIEAADLPKIFDPFYSTRDTGKGTGLGLAIVQTTVHNHGGFIHVSSVRGKGTRFDVYLPRIAGTAGSAGAAPPRDIPRGTETILLVEDDPDARDSATRMLQGLGYRVLPAANAGEALLVAENHAGQIELVLTDIVMPLISGIKLVDRLRQIRQEFKVLYTSGYQQTGSTEPYQAPALANFLQKPFDLLALGLAVRHALDA